MTNPNKKANKNAEKNTMTVQKGLIRSRSTDHLSPNPRINHKKFCI
jgi:hypothetical protein